MKGVSLILIFLFLFEVCVVDAFPLEASYSIDASWSTGYQATVTLTNPTNTLTTSWIATFTLPKGQSISHLRNGVYSAQGEKITVKNPGWVGGQIIPAGGSTTFGMIVSKTANGSPILYDLQATATRGVQSIPAPKAPVLNFITLRPNTTNSYTISWNSVLNATSYSLQQDTSHNFLHPKVVASGPILSYSVNNQPSGIYYYRVSASNAAGTSPFSNGQSIAVLTPAYLEAPVLQSINNPNGSSQYLVSWNDVENAQGYILQESTQSDFSNSQTIYQGPNISYQITGKSPGTYFYQVTAYIGSVTSRSSHHQETIVHQSTSFPSAVIEGHWESWNFQDSLNTIVNTRVEVIDIAFASFISTGPRTYKISGIESSQAIISQLVTLAHNLGKKVKISVGGRMCGLSGKLVTIQDAVGMAQAVASFVQQNSLDGVDFNIEDYSAPDLQIALIQNTRQLLGDSALISYTPRALFSTTYPYDQVIQVAHPSLTNISIMAYDYGSGYTYQQDIFGLESIGVPASKIFIGLVPDLHVMTSVDDIIATVQYVKSQGFGGVIFWNLNRDCGNLTGSGIDAATNAAWSVLSELGDNG